MFPHRKYSIPLSMPIFCSLHLQVALQLPDELLPLAPALAARLQQLSCSRQISSAPASTRRFAVLGDTSYGACCVDEVNAAHMSADAVIHYGHACLSAPASLPVLYVFDRLPVDVSALAATVAEAVVAARAASSSEATREAVLLLWEPGYAHALPAVLAEVGKRLAAATPGSSSSVGAVESAAAASGSAAACSGRERLDEPVRLQSPCSDDLIVPHFWRASVPAAARSRVAAAAASAATAAGSCGCSAEPAKSADPGSRALAAHDASADGSFCCGAADSSASASSAGAGCCGSAARPSSACCEGNGSGAAAAAGGCASGSCACSARRAAAGGAGTGEAAPPAPGQTAVSTRGSGSASVSSAQHVCCGLHYSLPHGSMQRDHARIRVLHVGVRPPRMRAVMLTYAAAAGLTFVDPAPAPAVSSGASASPAPARPLPTVSVAAQVRRQINAAYMHVESIRKARTLGIVAGTLAVAGRNEIIAALRAGAKAAGKAAYVLVVGKLTVAKLGNFPEIDAFVLVACPEQALLDVEATRAHAKPLVTPHEALVALTSIVAARAGGADSDDDGGSAEGGLSWAGAGELDFQRLVSSVKGLSLSAFAAPEGSAASAAAKGDGSTRSRRRKAGAAGAGADGAGKADFSTEGQFSDDDDDEAGDDAGEGDAAAAEAAAAETALVRRADSDSALSTSVFTSAAATYLQQKRTWRGLQYEYDPDAAVETASVARPLPASAASGGAGEGDASRSALVLVGSATADGGALAAGGAGAGARHHFDTRIREGLTGIASRYEKEHGSETIFAGKPVIASTAARE